MESPSSMWADIAGWMLAVITAVFGKVGWDRWRGNDVVRRSEFEDLKLDVTKIRADVAFIRGRFEERDHQRRRT